MNIEHH